MPLVVVAHVLFFEQIKFVGSEVVVVAKKPGDVHVFKSLRHVVVGGVPVVDKRTGSIFAGAVFAITAKLDCGAPPSDVQDVFVVGRNRHYVFVQTSPLAVYVIGGSELDVIGRQLVVEAVSTSVRHVTVSIGVACTPVKTVCPQCVCASQLTVVGRTTAVVIFRRVFVVRLCVLARSPRIAIVAQLIKNVFKLIFVFSAC